MSQREWGPERREGECGLWVRSWGTRGLRVADGKEELGKLGERGKGDRTDI